jgi:excinuclease UvrABC ATPase subunit
MSVDEKRQRRRIASILKQLKKEEKEVVVTNDDLHKWKCHLCCYERIDHRSYETHYLHFEDGSTLELCENCFGLCQVATLTKDCLVPRLGVICSEEYAKLVRLEHAN